MDLLPRTHQDFGNKDYWEKFFQKRTDAFEWYGEFPRLCGLLTKYVKTADEILMIGCGNSNLSAELYDVGYQKLVNIDISATVISQMVQKNLKSRPAMQFLQMDMLQMSFADNSFSVVLDKGTLDAVCTEDSEEVALTVQKMVSEISRVLRFGGRYVCFSLAQAHIANKVVRLFSDAGWMTRICRVPDAEQGDVGSDSLYLPVFAFIFTKFRKMSNVNPVFEVAYFEDQIQRLESIDILLSAVSEIQQYARVRNQLNKSRIEQQISVDLFSPGITVPRYTIYVVDCPTTMKNKFAIFIVPQGREIEWLFATDDGRKELQRVSGFERLLVVLLHREHKYASLDSVKAELSSKVLELAPSNVGNQSPFLSVGDDINLRTVQHCGRSEMSGDYVVEDIDVSGQMFRRLIFLSTKNVVQSEAKLIKRVDKKRKGRKNGSSSDLSSYNIDYNYLPSKYNEAIVAGLSFLGDMRPTVDSCLQLILVGLGGGGLAMYLRKNIPKIKIDVIEIDQAIVSVAVDWFGLTPDDQLVVHVVDGVQYLRELSSSNNVIQKDVIVLDVDNKDVSLGLTCPPLTFVDKEFLKCIHDLLKPSGLLILNLVCRCQELRKTVITNLKSIFIGVYSVQIPDDVNETLYCILESLSDVDKTESGKLPSVLESSLKNLQEIIQGVSGHMPSNDVLQLSTKLEGLQLL